MLAHYRRALAFRRAHPALVAAPSNSSMPMTTCWRSSAALEGERLLCVFNFAGEPAEWTVPAELGQLQMLDGLGQGARIEGTTLRARSVVLVLRWLD